MMKLTLATVAVVFAVSGAAYAGDSTMGSMNQGARLFCNGMENPVDVTACMGELHKMMMSHKMKGKMMKKSAK